jgi:hypothetical protein
MCGARFKSSAYWFLMKKTDFPDKCSACRLANREKMRAELEGVPKIGKEKPAEYIIETKEVKKGGKANGPKPTLKKAPLVKKEEPAVEKNGRQKFEDIVKDNDKNFPCLPE